MTERTPDASANRHAADVRIWTLSVGTAILALAVLTVVAPILNTALNAVTDHSPSAGIPIRTSPRLLASLGVASLIAAIACTLAVPAAFVVRTARARWIPLLFVPLLMPQYLAYAGWGLLRAPGTWLGGRLEQAAMDGATWAPLLVGKSFAVLGLALWSWPIAAVLIGVAARRLDPATLDALRLESSGLRRAAQLVAILRGPIFGAWLLVAALMLGSAVPLHVAQFDTFANAIWLALTLAPPDQRWRVTLAAWPMLAIAIVAGWLIASRLLRIADAGDAPAEPAGSSSRTARVYTSALWCASVLIPWSIFAANIRTPSAFSTFFRTSGRAISDSLVTSLVSALAAVALAAAVWFAAGVTGRPGFTTRLGIRIITIGAFIPGVLAGAMLLDTYNSFDFIVETRLIRVAADLSRFGIVAVLAGCVAAGAETDAHRAARRIDGADTPAGWIRTNLPIGIGLIVAAGLAVALLAFHEIEAAVIVQPPGIASLAQRILGYLHYARTEAMSAAGVVLIGGGALLALAAASLVSIATIRRTGPPTNR